MSPTDRALWEAMQRRAARGAPSVGLAILAAYVVIRGGMSEVEIARALQDGDIDRLLDELLRASILAVAFQPVRERLRNVLTESARSAMRHVPVPPGTTSREITVAFDTLNPRVITAIRTLESRVFRELTDETRAFARAFVEQGLTEGKSPIAIARGLRPLIGVPGSREQWIANYETALRGGPKATVHATALEYELRDKRFDAMVRAARKGGTPLTEAQIEKAVAGMRRKTIAYSAETVARTATLDALKLGQRLSWLAAADAGFVDRTLVRRRWAGVMDARERPEHVAMQGDTVGLDEPHSNGQTVPGDGDYNCRCIDVYFLAHATRP